MPPLKGIPPSSNPLITASPAPWPAWGLPRPWPWPGRTGSQAHQGASDLAALRSAVGLPRPGARGARKSDDEAARIASLATPPRGATGTGGE